MKFDLHVKTLLHVIEMKFIFHTFLLYTDNVISKATIIETEQQ
jgi:hypothetical protein